MGAREMQEERGSWRLLEELDSLGEVFEFAGFVRAHLDYLVGDFRQTGRIEAVALGTCALAELVQESYVLVVVVNHALLK